jgi:NAD(P)-dependent dehydrogenase (short-subunit alcohol dehydrogenase family)
VEVLALPRLEGQVAIVTGGAMGIGGATARRLAGDGARVLVADVEDDAAASNVQTIRQAGGTAEPLHVDVGTADGVRGMVEHAVGLWGRLDIVINNAYSFTGHGDAVELSEQDWDRAMDVGLKAMFRAAKYAVPHMRQTGGGSLVNLSSVHGLLVAPGYLVYETIKTAVIGLTRQMAAQYGPDGIRVNAVCPGHIVTERVRPQWDAHPDGLRFFEQQYPVRRTGKPVDIANAIGFLCSEDASFITGQALAVDGGLTLQLQENLGVHLARYIQEHPDTWFPY